MHVVFTLTDRAGVTLYESERLVVHYAFVGGAGHLSVSLCIK